MPISASSLVWQNAGEIMAAKFVPIIETDKTTGGPILRLQFPAPMQAWGKDEPWVYNRRTEAAPTKSAIVGIIGRAMGIDKDDTEQQKWLDSEVRDVTVEHISSAKRMVDDQIVSIQGYLQRGIELPGLPMADGKRRTVGQSQQPFSKEYIGDTLSDPPVVAVHGSPEFLQTVIEYLRRPIYPYYAGRYCCPMAGPIFAAFRTEEI